MLIAQELTYYGLDIYKKRMLPDLLHRLADVKGLEWIRLHYAYPSKFPLEIIGCNEGKGQYLQLSRYAFATCQPIICSKL